MHHSSISFPSHWVPLLEYGFLLAVLALVVVFGALRPAWLLRSAAAVPKNLRRVVGHARSSRRLVAASFLAGFLGNAVLCLFLGFPERRVSDGTANVFAAQTFAAGRLSNPPAPHLAVVPEHVVATPHFVSKYPPAQGLFLAVGVLAGHPGVGLWLTSGLVVASMAWCFSMWLPRFWAALGVLLVLLRIGIGSYWAHSYWGGAVAAAAGALVLGGVGSIRRSGLSIGNSFWLGAGLVLLALSRPFEGLVLALPVVVWLVGHCARELRSGRRSRVIVPMTLLFAVGAFGLLAVALYNQQTTDDWSRFAHRLYFETTPIGEEFVFNEHEQLHHTIAAAVGRAVEVFPLTLFFHLGPFLSLGLLFFLAWMAYARRWQWSVPVAMVVLVLAAHAMTTTYHAHYSAPATAAMLVLGLEGLRRLDSGVVRSRYGVAGLLIAGAVSMQIGSFVVQLPALRQDASSITLQQKRAEAWLLQQEGQHLIVAGPTVEIWNDPIPEQSRVVWARDQGDDANSELLDTFPGRRIWVFDWNQEPPVRSWQDGQEVLGRGLSASSLTPGLRTGRGEEVR